MCVRDFVCVSVCVCELVCVACEFRHMSGRRPTVLTQDPPTTHGVVPLQVTLTLTVP